VTLPGSLLAAALPVNGEAFILVLAGVGALQAAVFLALVRLTRR
jgi:hypothetical protein